MKRCEQLLKGCWASKPAPRHLSSFFHVLVLMVGVSMVPYACPPMMHAKLQAAAQLGTGLYVAQRKSLCATLISVSTHSGNSRPRHLHLLREVSVPCLGVKGTKRSYCKIALHFIRLYEAVAAMPNLDWLSCSQTDELLRPLLCYYRL